MKVMLIATGGTIDTQYDELKADFTYKKSLIPDMLKQGRSTADVQIEELELLNSQDITQDYLDDLLSRCINSDTDKIVITHGTNTMVDTAGFLSKSIPSKTIVLVGSMVPYAFKGSDALFNLGAAVTAVQILDKGVYVAMNGQIFTSDNVVKNFDIGEFQKKSA